MALTLSILAALLFGLAGWWMKMSQMKNGSIRTLMLGMYVVGALCFGIHSLIEGTLHTLHDYRALLLGLIIGLGSGLGNYLFMKALERGPASLISPLANTSIILVILLGVVVYDESLSLVQLISILFLVLATLLISQKRGCQTFKQSGWLSMTLIAALLFAFRNGGLKVAEELQLSSAPILFIAYTLSLIMFMLPSFHQLERKNTAIKTGWIFGLLTGIFSYGGLQLFAISMSYGQASIVAPIFATNGLIVTIGALFVYKEKLSPVQWIAYICLFIGIIGIKISL